MRRCGFTGAEVIEVIVRTHEVKQPPRQPDALASAVAQGCAARNAPPAAPAADEQAGGAGERADGAAADGCKEEGEGGEQDGERAAKRPKLAGAEVTKLAGAEVTEADVATTGTGGGVNSAVATAATSRGALLTRPYADMRGHTGFLLFCTKHVG